MKGVVKYLTADKQSHLHLSGNQMKKQETFLIELAKRTGKLQQVTVKRSNDPEDTKFMFWNDCFNENLVSIKMHASSKRRVHCTLSNVGLKVGIFLASMEAWSSSLKHRQSCYFVM